MFNNDLILFDTPLATIIFFSIFVLLLQLWGTILKSISIKKIIHIKNKMIFNVLFFVLALSLFIGAWYIAWFFGLWIDKGDIEFNYLIIGSGIYLLPYLGLIIRDFKKRN